MTGLVERLRRHWANPQSQHRQIAQGFLWVSLFVFVGKLAGAAKEMAIAWRYGVSATVDAYVFIFNLVNWPVSIWLNILMLVLVPLMARMRANHPAKLPRFRAELLGLTIGLGLIFGLLAWLLLPSLMRAGWLGLSSAVLSEALKMATAMALIVPLGLVISLLSTWLLAAGHHRNTLFEIIPALTILAFLFLPYGWIPEPLLWGTVAGFAMQMAALAAPLLRCGELPVPVFTQRMPIWRDFWEAVGIVAIGQFLMSITSILDQFFAAGLEPGSISILSYAQRVVALVLGLGGIAISRAVLPVVSRIGVTQRTEFHALVIKWAATMFGFGLVALICGWLFARLGVEILFERGAFTPKDGEAVTEIIRVSLLQAPFYFTCALLKHALASRGKYIWIVWDAVISLAVKITLIYILSRLIGLNGIVLSTVAMYTCSMIFLLYMLSAFRRKISE